MFVSRARRERGWEGEDGRTLMGYLEDGPEDFVAPLSLVRGVLGVFHLVAELEESVFDVVEPFGWGLAVFRGADRRHVEA